MKEKEMELIAGWINEVITNISDENMYAKVKKEIEKMCLKFPVPGIKI
jgi:glycine hydroxymethyltransferase